MFLRIENLPIVNRPSILHYQRNTLRYNGLAMNEHLLVTWSHTCFCLDKHWLVETPMPLTRLEDRRRTCRIFLTSNSHQTFTDPTFFHTWEKKLTHQDKDIFIFFETNSFGGIFQVNTVVWRARVTAFFNLHANSDHTIIYHLILSMNIWINMNLSLCLDSDSSVL